ncbi:hypothetical protein Mapa_005230 [Marchantia paleacea]|nr:hypothetical protein Mapa_005230 [Marchantia paleacea]
MSRVEPGWSTAAGGALTMWPKSIAAKLVSRKVRYPSNSRDDKAMQSEAEREQPSIRAESAVVIAGTKA